MEPRLLEARNTLRALRDRVGKMPLELISPLGHGPEMSRANVDAFIDVALRCPCSCTFVSLSVFVAVFRCLCLSVGVNEPNGTEPGGRGPK